MARRSPGDWLWTPTLPSEAFAASLYRAALFTLPEMVDAAPDSVLLANPVERYCIDLDQARTDAVDWTRGAKMRAVRRGRLRISVDNDFSGSLRRLIAYHAANEGGTWFCDALHGLIVRSHAADAASAAASSAGGRGVGASDELTTATLIAGSTVRLVGLNAKSKNGLVGRVAISAPPGAEARVAVRLGSAALGRTVGIKRLNLELVAPPPRVRHHVFELWDAETDDLLAITAGFGVGRAFHDYSMAALVRDKRSAGQVLTKTVAALLQGLGYGIWYWGFKVPYMAQYDRFGGRNIGRDEFNERWEALTAAEPDGAIEVAIAAGAALIAPRSGAPAAAEPEAPASPPAR